MSLRPLAPPVARRILLALCHTAPLLCLLGDVRTAAAEVSCNRRCLLEALTTYTEGVIDNDTSRIRVSEDVRVTSNGAVVGLGAGEVWGQVRRMPYRETFVDPSTGSALLFATVTNTPTRKGEKWWFYMLRLKVSSQVIAEVEEISYDGTLVGEPASNMRLPDRILDTVLPVEERVSRQELIATANKYFDVVSGTINYRDVPWHPECHRVELGVLTANSMITPGSCGGEFQVPRIKWIVKNRRVYVADVERGVVAAVAHFTSPKDFPQNNESVVFEVFKVQDGLIRHIEAMYRDDNTQKTSGWPDLPAP